MDLYDNIAPYYHLIYPDWSRAIEKQATLLSAIIKAEFRLHEELHDVSCGIGTQVLGLAKHFKVSGSDLSRKSIELAAAESATRGLTVSLQQADMRDLHAILPDQSVDVILSADNSLPHLSAKEEIPIALSEFYRVTRPGDGVLITIRDYEKEDFTTTFRPYGKRVVGDRKYFLFQNWDVAESYYDVSLFIVEDTGTACRTIVGRDRYFPVSTATVISLLKQAGFSDARRIESDFYQPVIVARK